MSKPWIKHSNAEKKIIFEKLADIYDEAGHPEELKDPSSVSFKVYDLVEQQV